MNHLNRRSLLATASLIASIIAAPAFAQAPDAAAAVEEVIVTGSRIINGNAMPTPVTVVSVEAMTAIQPGPIATTVGTLPAFAGNGGATGASTAGASLQLRFLGPERTLILLDGKRLAPTSYEQVVDANTIPSMLLSRVDVVTGGVGAVYGSEAVAGVVNFIVDRNFNGTKMEATVGASQPGDSHKQNFGVAFGAPVLDGRGHFEASYEIHNQDGLSRRSKRHFGENVLGQFGLGTAAVPLHTIDNARNSDTSFGGFISGATGAGAVLNNRTFGADSSTLYAFNPGIPSGQPGVSSGGDGAYHDAAVSPDSRNDQAFARFDFDVTDNLHFYVDGGYSTAEISGPNDFARFNVLQMSGTNAFLPAQYQFNGTFRLSKFDTKLPRELSIANKKSWFYIAGLEGSIGDYKWDIAVNRGQAENKSTASTQIDLEKFYAAIDAVKDASGAIVCRAAQLNPSKYSGCVPYNIFGVNSPSDAAMAYINSPTYQTAVNTMTDFTANIAGSPFSIWAGPVQLALSGEYRINSFEVDGVGHPQDLQNCTGLQFNCAATTPKWFNTTSTARSRIKKSVAEAGIEADIPLLADLPFFKVLSFNGGYRYIDYETSGKAETYKLGLNWEVNDDLKLRATRSADIRAANLYELYFPETVTVQAASDRLFGLSGVQTPRYSGGNPNLTPEKAETTTIGVIYRPGWLPRSSFSIDAFNIDIKNVVYSGSGASTATQFICYNSLGTSPLCQLITRALGSYTSLDPRNVQTAFYIRLINASSAKTYGIDFESSYSFDVAGNPLTLRGLVTWQPHSVLTIPGPQKTEGAGYAFSSFSIGGRTAMAQVRGTIFANYSYGDFEFSLRERFRSKLRMDAIAGNVVTDGALPVGHNEDLTVTYTLPNKIWGAEAEVSLNIQNLFDIKSKNAALNSATGIGDSAGWVGGDDPVGRFFNLGVKARF